MTRSFSPLNALAAAGICAALAMLGTEIDAQRPSVIRYEYSIVLPDPAAANDADSPSSQDDRPRGPHHGRRGDSHDDDGGDQPFGEPEPDDTIPT
jgi:hypothetical protein